MKKFLLAAVILFAIQACSDNTGIKDPEPPEPPEIPTIDPEIGVVIANIKGDLSENINKVSFVARYHTQNPDVDWGVMLTIPFEKDATTLIFPVDPPAELFGNITDDIPDGFVISDPEAKTIAFTEFAFHESDELKRVYGVFKQMKTDGKIWYEVQYIYCDRPVKISGVSKDWWRNTTTYDLTLKKGWNLTVRKEDTTTATKTVTISKEVPEGIEWICDYWIGGR